CRPSSDTCSLSGSASLSGIGAASGWESGAIPGSRNNYLTERALDSAGRPFLGNPGHGPENAARMRRRFYAGGGRIQEDKGACGPPPQFRRVSSLARRGGVRTVHNPQRIGFQNALDLCPRMHRPGPGGVELHVRSPVLQSFARLLELLVGEGQVVV